VSGVQQEIGGLTLWRELFRFYIGHHFNNVDYLVITARKRGTNNVVASLHS
jgi:hypothetical protein